MTDTTNRAADEDYFDDDDIVEVEDIFDEDDDIVDLDALDGEDTGLAVVASEPMPVQITQRDANGEESTYTIDLATPPLNREEALELTERIKDTTNALYILIKRAHAGRAYAALGYSTFEEYVKREFDISRSYAYRLLTQANVIEAIEAVVPDDATFSLNVSQANALKPVLPQVLAELQERTAGLEPDEATGLISQVVEEQRAKEASMRAEAEEADYQGSEYSGDYDPEYAKRNQDEDEDDAFDAEADADTRSSAEVAAQTQRRYQALYAVYAALTNIASSKDFDELLEVIPPQRYNEFSELFELAVDRLQEYRTTFAEWVEAHPAPSADVDFDDDDDDDDDDFEGFDDEA